MCRAAGGRKIEACPRDLPVPAPLRRKEEPYEPNRIRRIPDGRLSRRSAVGRLAGAGAAAVVAAAGLGMSRGAAQGAPCMSDRPTSLPRKETP